MCVHAHAPVLVWYDLNELPGGGGGGGHTAVYQEPFFLGGGSYLNQFFQNCPNMFWAVFKDNLLTFLFLRKKGSQTKKRMREEEIEKGDCGPPTRKVFF